MPLYPEAPNFNYAAGLVDFSPIGNLANDYYAGAENKRKYDVARTFQDGLPRDAAGNIDFNRAAEMLATRGDASQLVPLANVDLQRKFLGSALSDSQTAFPSSAQPGPQTAAPQAAPDQSEPRGVRNSNLGNIKDGSFARSQPGYVGSDGTFAKFETPEHGIAAATTLLGRYGQTGINTIQGVVNRWAPAGDGNNVPAYVASVAKALGVAPDAPLDLSKPEVSRALAQAMFAVENGKPVGQSSGGAAPAASASPERPVIPPHGIPQGSADGSPPPAAPVRVAGPAMAPGPPSAPSGSAAAPSQQAAPAAPQSAPAGGAMPAALRPMIPAKFNDPMQYVNFLRQKQAAYEAAGLAGVKGADGAAKAYGAQADKIMDAIGKFYELTPEQKNAMASGGLDPLQFENSKQQGRVTAENSALTPEAKNFLFDQRQKGNPASSEAPTETLVEQQARAAGEKKQAENSAERYGKRYDAIIESGQRARMEGPQLDLAKKLMEDPNFYSGVGEKYNLLYKRILTAVGGDQNAAAPQEAFRKIIANSILDQIKQLAGTGQIRVAEINIMKEAAANAENTPAGNKVLVEIASRLQQRAADIASIAQSYKNGRLDPGFDRMVRTYDEGKLAPQAMQSFGLQRQGTLLNDDEIKNFRNLIGGKGNPTPKVIEGATATNPKTGERMKFEGGKWVPFS